MIKNICGMSLVLAVILLNPTPTHAGSTGQLRTTTMTAVTSSAGDNNGFETTYGTTTPKDTTTTNTAGIESVNSGTAASTSCALPNTSSDQAIFSNFNVSLPAGAVITGITVTIRGHYDSATGTNTFCTFLSPDGGSTWTAGQKTGDVNASDVTNTLGGTSNLWGRSNWSASEVNNTNFRLRLMTLVASTSRDAFIDYLAITVSYNSPPNPPGMYNPTNGETDVSTTPELQFSASDPDGDNLGYKVVIYSDSGCSSALQTYDQAVSSAGWIGQNATCVNSPTSCYGSSITAGLTLQSALSSGTEYWWRASAFDPDGSGVVIDATSCNSFTTLSPIISVSLTSSGTISYGFLGPGAQKNTTTNGISATQTVQNDGNVLEDLTIKTTNATGGIPWSLGESAGTNMFVHEFSTNSGGAWTKFSAADTYQSLISNLGAGSTQDIDFRLTGPTASTDLLEKTITVTILAAQH